MWCLPWLICLADFCPRTKVGWVQPYETFTALRLVPLHSARWLTAEFCGLQPVFVCLPRVGAAAIAIFSVPSLVLFWRTSQDTGTGHG